MTDEFPQKLDPYANSADPDIRDALVGIAKKQDEDGYAILCSKHKPQYIRVAAEEGVISILRELYGVCNSIIDTKNAVPNSTQIMQKLILPGPIPETVEMRKKALDLIRAVQWLKLRSLSIALPKTISRLWRVVDAYFSPDITYLDVQIERAEAENLILTVAPIITYPEGSIARIDDTTGRIIHTGIEKDILQEYVDRIVALLQIIPDDGELWGSYMIRTSNTLYYFQLACDLILAAQTAEGEDDDALINREVAFALAPALLLPIAAMKDNVLKQLMLPTSDELKKNLDENNKISSSLFPTQDNANPNTQTNSSIITDQTQLDVA